MPIYIEAKGIEVEANPFASHSYLLYVPIGENDNYAAWRTIGAYPLEVGIDGVGSGSLLDGDFIDYTFADEDSEDGWTINLFSNGDISAVATSLAKPEAEVTVADMVASGYGLTGGVAADARSREVVYLGTDAFDEGNIWNSMVETAIDISEEYTYRVVDLIGGDPFLFGPTVNSNSFVTSLLRHEATEGTDILAFETSDITPGDLTWLGTTGADYLDATLDRPNGEEARDLFGGKGVDKLIGGNDGSATNEIYLVAGDDFDQDDVRGGAGEDILVGYFNQSDLGRSDKLHGGDGDDTFHALSPDTMLPGGIPPLSGARRDPAAVDMEDAAYKNGGQAAGSGGQIDGGADYDILDLTAVWGGVDLILDGDTIRNIERIDLGVGDDHAFISNIAGLERLYGSGGENRFSLVDLDGGVSIAQPSGFTSPLVDYWLEDENGQTTGLTDFTSYDLTPFDDEANFQQFDEAGEPIELSGSRVIVSSAEGSDTLTGSGGHDDLHGGAGDDVIRGGSGADVLYDSGLTRLPDEGEDPQAYAELALVYETGGNDIVEGGAGSDLLVFSGGTDLFEGGAGHDTYQTVAQTHSGFGSADDLTILLREDVADPETYFGNDFILGDGKGVDRVRFEGIGRNDVTVTYAYEEELIGTQVVPSLDSPLDFSIFSPFPASSLMSASFQAFDWWVWETPPQQLEHYRTVGSMQITVNATGSSLTIEEVTGYQTRGDNGVGNVRVEASIGVPFAVEFDDGLLDWPGSILDPGTGSYTFRNEALGANAFAARDAHAQERATLQTDIAGTDGDDTLFGTSVADRIDGGSGDDVLRGGSFDDLLIGGAGADVLYGGSGTDTASYATATSGVGAILDPNAPSYWSRFGDAEGDVYDGIENFTGSAFDDRLYGDSGANLIEGGAGNDRIVGRGGLDTLKGGDGDDEITANVYIDDDDVLYISDTDMHGGAGNDILKSSSGNDLLSGGAGDDVFELSFYHNFWTGNYNPGNDTIDGGAGIDRVEFRYGAVTVDLAAGQARYTGIDDTVVLRSVENVRGSREADLLIGDSGNNVLDGDGGDDTLVGGAGDDQLYADGFNFQGNAFIHGGTGIDTAYVLGFDFAFDEVGIELVDGALRIIDANDDDSQTIFDDVEFVMFDDGVLKTYQELAQGLIAEAAAIDDFVRVDEGHTVTLDVLANDLSLAGDPLAIETIEGVAADPGAVIRLASGATVTIENDGTLTLDQGGAYAWLDANESATTALSYTATDSSGMSRAAKATLVIDGIDTSSGHVHLGDAPFVTEADPNVAAAFRIGDFDISRTPLVVNKTLIDPNEALPAGVELQEIDGDTYVTFGGDDAVILDDVSLDAWRHAYDPVDTEGTDGDDLLVDAPGTINQDLSGLGGDDLLFGRGGADDLRGGAGDDMLFGGDGDDRLLGGPGDDRLFGGPGDDVVWSSSPFGYIETGGVDFYDGGEGFDRLDLQNEFTDGPVDLVIDMVQGTFRRADGLGTPERFTRFEQVNGGSANDYILGSDGDDWLDGVGGDDTLIGGAGDDTLTDGYGDNDLSGGTGNDKLLVSDGNNVLRGDAGNDELHGGRGDDTLLGGTGNDVLSNSPGTDTYDGGAGVDTLDFSVSPYVFPYVPFDADFDLVAGTVVFADGRIEVAVGIENVIGSEGDNVILGDDGANFLDGDEGDDTIDGGAGDDTIQGGDGDDAHFGGDGDDLILGSLGADSFDGGEGTDTLDFSYSASAAEFDLGLQSVVFSGGFTETLTGFENVVGTRGANVIVGDATENVLDGHEGDDVLTGEAGADTFVAAVGTDRVTDFEIGVDSVRVDGTPLNPEVPPVGVTLAQDSADVRILHDGGVLILEGLDLSEWIASVSGPNVIVGTDAADVLTGTESADEIDGGAGADEISALGGDDIIRGGTHDDVIDAGAGNDEVWGGKGRDTVMLGDGNDVFHDSAQTGGYAHDSVWGGAGDDQFRGGGGNDVFRGEAGADTLTGGTGRDVLWGGAGTDMFIFAEGDGLDVIEDFELGIDTIEIDGVLIDPGTLPGNVSAVQDGADVLLAHGGSDTIRLRDHEIADWDHGNGGTDDPSPIGEAGSLAVAQATPDQWHTVTFSETILEAVVVMGPVGSNDDQAAITRVRNVGDTGFEFQIDEWDYLDGVHGAETVSWMAVSEGTHILASGQTLVAGTSNIGTSFASQAFGSSLVNAVVLAEVTSANDAAAVTTRLQAVTANGFEVKIEEEEAADGVHSDEEVAWIAVEAGVGAGVEMIRGPDSLTHGADTFAFSASFEAPPVLMADLQTYDGPDTSGLRYDDLSVIAVDLFVQEEQSKDIELGHTSEVAGLLAIEEGLIF